MSPPPPPPPPPPPTHCAVFDLRNAAVELFYSPTEDFEVGLDAHMDTTATHLGKLDAWLTQHGTPFLAGARPTAPDFHLFEMIDQVRPSETHTPNAMIVMQGARGSCG
jgi:glutathione S-transferase